MVAQCQNAPEVLILFYKPERASFDWLHTDNWALANCIPHSSAIIDSGNEAQVFDAKTSGHTLIYNNAGQLIFAGGNTGSRGHEGDNFGRAQALIALRSNSRNLNTPPTFGCLLHSQ